MLTSFSWFWVMISYVLRKQILCNFYELKEKQKQKNAIAKIWGI